MLLLSPCWVRRKREDDFGRIGPALFAGTNNFDSSINKISSTSYLEGGRGNNLREIEFFCLSSGFFP